MTWTLWLTFFGVCLALAIAPGPDNLFVLAQSLRVGVKQALMVVLGLCGGLVIQTLATMAGFAAVVAANPWLFRGIQWLGAAYLCYLAWGAWRAGQLANDSVMPTLSMPALLARGFIMNITNPKVLIFFLMFFPTFITTEHPTLSVTIQTLILGATFILATLIVFSAIALGAGLIAHKLRSARTQQIMNRLSALIFVALAAWAVFGH